VTWRRALAPGICVLALLGSLALSPSALSYTFGPTVTQTGPEQTVFDWTTQRCEDNDIPDLPARAFRDWQGKTQLIDTHYTNRRMRGSSLNTVTRECPVIMSSHNNPNPAAYDHKEWISSTWTSDGKTIHALIHNEFQGHALGPSVCPSLSYPKCWYNSISYARSTNKGSSYSHSAPPSHLVSSVPYRYIADTGPYGVFEPSNIIYTQRPGDSQAYYYALLHLENYPSSAPVQKVGVCVMRTLNLSDPTSWRAWDGTGFNVRFMNPYTESDDPSRHVCQPVSFPQIEKMENSVTYNTYFGKYLVVGPAGKYDPATGVVTYGIFYSLSSDLVNWSDRQLLMEASLPWACPTGRLDQVLYPSLLDPASTSRNYETTGQRPFLYFTHFNYACGSPGTLDRDLIRIPIQFTG
jgi:hypothetical protein